MGKAAIAGLHAGVLEQLSCRLVGDANAIRLDIKAADRGGVVGIGEHQGGARFAQPVESSIKVLSLIMTLASLR